MFTSRLLALLLLALTGSFTMSSAPPSQGPSKSSEVTDLLDAHPRSRALAANIAWHKQVGKDEIRMSWFLGGDPGIAMVCKVDLSASKATTSREVYDWASQNNKTHELNHDQIQSLRKLVKSLPPSAKTRDLHNLVLVSVVEEGRAKIFLYGRSDLPKDLIRLYDLSGAESVPIR